MSSDVVLQNYHIPAGVSEAAGLLCQTPRPLTFTHRASDPVPPHVSADIGEGATVLPGSKPRHVHQARALSAPALAGQPSLWYQVPTPGLWLWRAPVPGAAPGRGGDAASAAPREWAWMGPGRAALSGPQASAPGAPALRALEGRGGRPGRTRASVLGAEKLPGGDAGARGRKDDLPLRVDALYPPPPHLPGHQLVTSPLGRASHTTGSLCLTPGHHPSFLPWALLPEPHHGPGSALHKWNSPALRGSGLASLCSKARAELGMKLGRRSWPRARSHQGPVLQGAPSEGLGAPVAPAPGSLCVHPSKGASDAALCRPVQALCPPC